MNNRALDIQFLWAERARSMANLASSRFASLYHPSQNKTVALAAKLCFSISVINNSKKRQLKRARKRMLETSKKAAIEGIKMFVILAGRDYSQDDSLEELIEKAGRYLSTDSKKIINKASFLDPKLELDQLTNTEVLFFGRELDYLWFTFEEQLNLVK